MIGTCGGERSGTSSPPSCRARATRCALYDGIASTRNCGRQSSSQHMTSRRRPVPVTSVAIMSSSPRTAFTGVPSGAFTESGTPKYARKYSDAVSSRSSGPTPAILPGLAAIVDHPRRESACRRERDRALSATEATGLVHGPAAEALSCVLLAVRAGRRHHPAEMAAGGGRRRAGRGGGDRDRGALPWQQARTEAGRLLPVLAFLGAILVLGHVCQRGGTVRGGRGPAGPREPGLTGAAAGAACSASPR